MSAPASSGIWSPIAKAKIKNKAAAAKAFVAYLELFGHTRHSCTAFVRARAAGAQTSSEGGFRGIAGLSRGMDKSVSPPEPARFLAARSPPVSPISLFLGTPSAVALCFPKSIDIPGSRSRSALPVKTKEITVDRARTDKSRNRTRTSSGVIRLPFSARLSSSNFGHNTSL